MNQTSLKLLLCIVTVVSLYACSGSLKVSASKADPAELMKYKTYAWIAPGDTALNTRRDDKMFAGLIQRSADKELQNKGMKIDNQNPDAVFMFDTHIDENVENRHAPNSTNGSMGYAGYTYGYFGAGYYSGVYNPMQGLETTYIIVEEGTLGYSMYDRKTGKILWSGSATTNLDEKTDVEAVIKKATTFIFAKLPVKHK